jgi:predicted nucleotidyltransferase
MILDNIKFRILEYFFINPTKKLRIRQIARDTNSPLPSTIRYVKDLVKEEILRKEDIAKIVLYSANRSNKNYLLQKKLYNIESLYHSKIIDYLKEYNAQIIILFGSYSKGEDIEESDIDIYIECKNLPEDLTGFEKKLHRRIQLFKYKNILSIENKQLANNIINGLILEGYAEVFK